MKKALSLVLCLLLFSSLFGCDMSGHPPATSVASEDAPEPDAEIAWQILPGKVDLLDLQAVSNAFIDPLKPDGYPWFYSWDSIKALDPDDYISILSYYNYLNLPLGTERYDNPHADGDLVEADLCPRFGIDKETLRSARLYDAKNHTYLLLVGGGGPDQMVASSAEKDEDLVTIEVSYHFLSYDTVDPDLIGSFLPDNQQDATEYGYSQGYLFPMGTLIVRLSKKGNAFQYISYRLYDEAYARHDTTNLS